MPLKKIGPCLHRKLHSEIYLNDTFYPYYNSGRHIGKKRYTVRWTKFGDESTNFFHAAATERYRLNTITSIDTEDGRTITDHHEKANLLWEEYKFRMSQTSNPTILYDLQSLFQQHDLQHLSQPFTTQEIDDVVKHMPADKAPRPDGFNGCFIKKC